MAIDKKQLLELLRNPAMLSAEDVDVEPETMDDAFQQSVEGSDIDPEAMPMEEAPAEETTPESMVAQNYEVSPEIKALMQKMQGGQPNPQDAEVAQEEINDPQLSPDVRKAAIQKIKQKYLGR